jgi:hypothetical protein
VVFDLSVAFWEENKRGLLTRLSEKARRREGEKRGDNVATNPLLYSRLRYLYLLLRQ